ncbi:MAG: hypothetical protein ACWA5Q_06440 [bacterium]
MPEDRPLDESTIRVTLGTLNFAQPATRWQRVSRQLMDLHFKFTRDQKYAIARTLATVALANGNLSRLERTYIKAFDHYFLFLELNPEELGAIDLDQLPGIFPDKTSRSTLMDLCILLTLVNGNTDLSQGQCLDEVEHALGLRTTELALYRHIALNQMEQISEVLDDKGMLGLSYRAYRRKHPSAWLFKKAQRKLGLGKQRLTARYRNYGNYPPGSLGRAYYEFMTSNQLSFPGEQTALSEYLVNHDLAHVLGGFGTTPEEEILVVAFQSGAQKYNPFYSILSAISLFHLGLETSGYQVAAIQTMNWKPDSFFRELYRGTQCKVDFANAWDFQPYMKLPLEEARRKLGIPPRI